MSSDSSIQRLPFSLTQFITDFIWAFQELSSSRKDASLKRAIRFCFHTLLSLKTSAIWLRFLRESNLLTTSVKEATFVDRIHRPFFDRRCNTTQRSQFLRSHFSILSRLLDSRQLHLVVSGSGINLATLAGKTGAVIEISLVRLPDYDKEGAATIVLAMNGRTIQVLTFTIVRQQKKMALKIGGIQTKEYPHIDSRALVREVTAALYGIQPRILMIETLRNFAQQLGSEVIECIGENNHIYRALRYRNKRKIHAQYNQLWSLVGGTEMADGNFIIPSFIAEKSIESRPSKKRNEYRNRAALLEALRSQMIRHPANENKNSIDFSKFTGNKP